MEKGFEKILNKRISRRAFLKCAALGLGALAFGIPACKKLDNSVFEGGAPDELWKWSREAYHYTKLGKNVQCNICPHQCILKEGDRSFCRDKVHMNGKLYTLAYGNPCAVHIDPIEKKPLFHFLPESKAFSIATAGCNFRCLNCQNWDISQFQPEETKNIDLMPEKVVDSALLKQCQSIAYTYSEPIAFYEYMYDTSKLAREKNIKNVWVTNGYINEEALRDLAKYLDAANVDLKSFENSIYNELNAGTLKPILNTFKVLKEEKVWFEITNLVIPSWTDDLDMIREMCSWLAENGYEDYPLHFSRFTPMYKLTHLPPTPISVLKDAREIAMDAGIKFVYIGNVPGNKAESTYCPKCGRVVIGRRGYTITENNLENGSCKFCGEKIPGVWEA
ncbi:AmmeMemoRadiSam system radical SAM enzyme [Candidatus Woesearchaeota archaeon]|nr:MAG: AmmeMemoRadiSam system radical SAM enzyme [Candidatus Woesearchaeota archaeon]